MNFDKVFDYRKDVIVGYDVIETNDILLDTIYNFIVRYNNGECENLFQTHRFIGDLVCSDTNDIIGKTREDALWLLVKATNYRQTVLDLF